MILNKYSSFHGFSTWFNLFLVVFVLGSCKISLLFQQPLKWHWIFKWLNNNDRMWFHVVINYLFFNKTIRRQFTSNTSKNSIIDGKIVKLGCNDHGYNEFTLITSKLLLYFWSQMFLYSMILHGYNEQFLPVPESSL